MDEPFYENGLKFSCTRCNKCCRHDSGYVFLSKKDINKLKEALQLSEKDFKYLYTKKVDLGIAKRITLLEQENFDCIFWKDGGCSVYNHRPLQCQAFPFWPQNLSSAGAWEDTGDECPGIHVGKLHTRQTIDSWLTKRKQEPFVEE